MAPKTATKMQKVKAGLEEKSAASRSSQPAEESHYPGKWFALCVFFAGLSSLYYWYTSYQASASLSYVPSESGTSNVGEPPVFKVVDIPGKGKGILAERDIKQGELVLKEKPLFVVPRDITSSPAALIYNKLQLMTAEQRRAYLDLSYVNFSEDLDPVKNPSEVALAIFQTNAVSAGENVGIFPRMARLNHGCSSAFNVVYNWRHYEQQLVVHALKDIKKGEELLTTYTDTKRPKAERRTFLASRYGFQCTCYVCSLPPQLSKASDSRLSEISKLYGEFASWSAQKIDGNEAIEMIRKIWNIEDQEGYLSERGSLAADAVWIAAAHSDSERVREWGLLAMRWFSNEIGADTPQVKDMERYVSRPETHKAWGTRSRLDVGAPGRSR
ncbi:hypothetical protein CPB83DRAFT_873273 [Crepidotus variabilis]|uniref:SET domain-containing protein n=1 Tax=Crepidotus variabilis TaxID=179855 RepID=A0A9P6ESU2_9AGAR|nr:hypothetical protein CPB83DRAFT_873273 [Crepidotus variabilis]